VYRARFAFLFRSRYALHVKNRPKSIRGLFRLQEEQYCSCGPSQALLSLAEPSQALLPPAKLSPPASLPKPHSHPQSSPFPLAGLSKPHFYLQSPPKPYISPQALYYLYSYPQLPPKPYFHPQSSLPLVAPSKPHSYLHPYLQGSPFPFIGPFKPYFYLLSFLSYLNPSPPFFFKYSHIVLASSY
jgi:hypothetical protein